MAPLADHVSSFIRSCEALHWALLEGHALTSEDRDLIQQTAVQLLMRVEGSTDAPAPQRNGKAWKRWDEQIEEDLYP